MELKVGKIYEFKVTMGQIGIGRYLGTHEDLCIPGIVYNFFEIMFEKEEVAFGVRYKTLLTDKVTYKRPLALIKKMYPNYSNKEGKFYSRIDNEVIKSSVKRLIQLELNYLYE